MSPLPFDRQVAGPELRPAGVMTARCRRLREKGTLSSPPAPMRRVANPLLARSIRDAKKAEPILCTARHLARGECYVPAQILRVTPELNPREIHALKRNLINIVSVVSVIGPERPT